MADDRSREPFNKGNPVPGGGPPSGPEKKPLLPPAKAITPIPLKKPDPLPVKPGALPLRTATPIPRPAGSPGAGDEKRIKVVKVPPRSNERLASLDAYRGFIMLLLAAGGFGIAAFANIDAESPVWKIADRDVWQKIAFHFNHPAWRSNFLPSFLETTPAAQQTSEFLRFGVSFWDLIQPAFMFMVGVAMPFSNSRRWSDGQSAPLRFVHAMWRALALVLLGVFLYSLGDQRTNWIFPNVLAQIGLGYIFAYMLMPFRAWAQIAAIALILVAYWGLFKIDPPPAEYDYAAVNASVENGEVYEGKFAPAHNFDRRFLNMLRTLTDDEMKAHNIPMDARSWAPEPVRRWFFENNERFLFNGGGYQTLNFIPSIGTTLLGILCGQLLLSTAGKGRKFGVLLVGGAVCIALGLAMGEFACPIVKRIWTPSWVLFSGGYVIWMLALFYFLFDVLPLKVLAFPLAILGMNSLAVYLMGELLRTWTLEKVVEIHFSGILESIFGAEKLQADMFAPIIFPAATVFVFWLVCLWMYRRKIFVRL